MYARSKSKPPSPTELLAEVKHQPSAKTYPFEEYLDVVHELKIKDHSYAEIADFLAKRLGMAIKRGQVYRAYRMWLEQKADGTRQDTGGGARKGSEPVSEDQFGARAEAREVDKLVAMIDEKFSGGPLQPDALLSRALGIIRERQEDERRAEEADLAVEKR